jgi:membrane protease YdiL (CAAX protease family)
MAVECAALAVLLLSCVQIQRWMFDQLGLPIAALPIEAPPIEAPPLAVLSVFPRSVADAGIEILADRPLRGSFAHLVSYFGAGVYEETLFRLMLLPLCTAALRAAKVTPRTSIVIAVILTSALFSAAHHVGAAGEPLDPFRITFRFAAGMLFCVVFLFRGFGIAVGTHALYDVFAGWS